MALNVQLNTRISSKILGTINENYSYFDPLTGTNLSRSKLVSADLSGFSPAQLVNISNAVYMGTLSVVNGASGLPAHTATFSSYSLYASGGMAGGGAGTGITGIAAASSLQKNF